MEAEAVLEVNPYIIDLHQLGRLAFFSFLVGVFIFLLLKIIVDLRKHHYKN